jgi:hypothetical protein
LNALDLSRATQELNNGDHTPRSDLRAQNTDSVPRSDSHSAMMSNAEFDALPYYSDVEGDSDVDSVGSGPIPHMYSRTYRMLNGDSISTLDTLLVGGIAPPPGFSPTPRHVMSFNTPSMLALDNSPRGPPGSAESDSSTENDPCFLHIGNGLPPRNSQRQSIARAPDGQRRLWIITPGRPARTERTALQTYLDGFDSQPQVNMRGGAGSEHDDNGAWMDSEGRSHEFAPPGHTQSPTQRDRQPSPKRE